MTIDSRVSAQHLARTRGTREEVKELRVTARP